MKRHGIHSASCSCTSCVYRSRSKQPSVQQLIEEGSRIDKLYYGKYLPLRERKLLEKLIRTRAVYDDVRNQLLSTSGSSDQSRSIHKIKRRDDDSTERSSAVIKFVDLVDRGQIGSSNTSKLSSCCSCCSCASLEKIKKHMKKHPPKVHRHYVPYESIARYTIAAEKKGRKRRRRLSSKISGKIRSAQLKIKKIRSEPCTCTLSLSSVKHRPSKADERATVNAQAQKVVAIERKALKKRICNCSCKIAKLPMKSIRKISKNIRKSNTKSSGTVMDDQKAFRIKKDSLTLFREKLLKKRALKDWECEPGTCVVDECIPEQCLEKIKARGVGETRKRKHHHRLSGPGIDRNRISISTRPKKVKTTVSKVQASPDSILGPVICECKPTSKSASSMTSFAKSKSVAKIQSMTTDLKVKQPKSPKRKAQFTLKETHVHEKATGHHTLRRTDSLEWDESKQEKTLPKSNLGSVICECKPSTKAIASMTTIPNKQYLKSVSRTAIKAKRPMTPNVRYGTGPPKARPQTVIKKKAYKTGRRERDLVQVSPKHNLRDIICECKPSSKSTASVTTVHKKHDFPSISKTEIKVKRPITPKARPQRPQISIRQKKVYKTGRRERDLVQVSPKSNLGNIICECKPSSKSAASMTTIHKKHIHSLSKTEIKVKRPITPKARPQIVVTQEKAYITDHRERELVRIPTKSNLGHAICECKPSTKSEASMTTIPKKHDIPSVSRTEIKVKRPITPKARPKIVVTQEKAYTTDHRERELVRVPTKSNLGHAICECKPSTKSKASMTTIPKKHDIPSVSRTEIKVKRPITPKARPQIGIKEKAYKTGHRERKLEHVPNISKQEKVYKTPRYKSRKEQYQYHDKLQEPEKQAVKISSSFKFEIEFSKKKYPALTNKELLDHVNTKRAKLINKTHDRNKHKRKYQQANSESKSSQENQSIKSYLTESASQASEPFRGMVLPFPRECEPLMCIPYKCDPQKCARILLSRSKFRGRSAMSNTDRLRRKSARSTTSQSQKTSSKSIYIQSNGTKSDFSNPKILKYDTSADSSHPQKQAVRIASNFSFNIEFYKEKAPQSLKTDGTRNLSYNSEHKIVQNAPRKKNKKGYAARNINARHVSSQSRSSQSFKNAHVAHRLKRCFCTLKLLQKKKQKVKHAVSKKTMASLYMEDLEKRSRIRETQTESWGIAYVIPPATSHPCNPYECAQKLKERNRKEAKRYAKQTNTTSTPRKSTFTSQEFSKSSSRKIQSSDINKKVKRSHASKLETDFFSDNTVKQAVRIGSSFSINIEFSKEKKYEDTQKDIGKEFVSIEPVNKGIRRMQHKGIKVHKPRVRYMGSSATRNVKTKQTNTTPFLQKCFCTLKLLKKNKRASIETPHRNDFIVQMQNKSITNKRANTYHPEKLLPYECQLGICDPYECEKLIKLHQKKSQQRYSNTGLISKSTLSETSRTINSSESRNTKSYIRRSKEKAKRIADIDSNELNIISSQDKRQVVRVRSSFNFNIEFSKDNLPANKNTEYLRTHGDISKKSIKKLNKGKLKAIGSQQLNPRLYHKAINAEVKRKEQGIYVGSAIRRCFCTLNFNKKGKNTGPQEKNEIISKSTKTSYPLINPQKCECKSTKTSNVLSNSQIRRLIYDLKSYECAPDFCIPGMCNPFECYEELKRRDIKRLHDRHIGTEKHERRSISSMTKSEIDKFKAKSTQSRFLKQTPLKEHKVKRMHENIRPTHSISPSRQMVRLGSNFSFNVDFFKDTVIPPVENTVYKIHTDKYNRISDTATVKTTKDKGTKDKGITRKDSISQENKIWKKNKASNIGFLLRRCFCTLSLQKKISQKIKKPKREFYGNQPVTAQFVQVDHVDQNKNKACNFAFPDVKRRPELKKVNDKSDKTLYQRECFELKLLRDSYHLKQNILNMSRNSKNNVYPIPQNLKASRTLIKSNQSRSRIDFNIDEYQVGYSNNNNIQETNPYFQSYCALNLKVSNIKNNPAVKNNTNVNKIKDTNPLSKGLMPPTSYNPKQAKDISTKSLQSNVKYKDSQINTQSQSKTTSVLNKCLCSLKLRKKSEDLISLKNKTNQCASDAPLYKDKQSQVNLRNGKRQKSAHRLRKKQGVGIDMAVGCHSQHTDSRRIPNKTKGKSTRLAMCLSPIKTKSHNSYNNNSNSVRIGSGLSISLEFFKETNSNRGDMVSNYQKKDVQQSHLRHTDSREIQNKSTHLARQVTDSQKKNEGQNKPNGISNVLTRCLCKIKKNKKSSGQSKKDIGPEKTKAKKDVATMVKKPYGSNERLSNNKICVPGKCDPHKCSNSNKKKLTLKNMSTSSVAKKTKTKTVKSKPKDRSTSIGENQKDDTHKKPSEKRTVSFGSSCNLNLEFFKDQIHLLSSNLSPASTRTPEQYQVFYSSVESSGDNRRRFKGLGAWSCGCKSKLAKSLSKDKKNKNPKGRKHTKSVKSAFTERSTATKGKRISKSYDQCSANTCEEKFKLLGLNDPDVKKPSKNKAKNEQKQSLLKRCLCNVTSNVPTNAQTVTGKRLKNQSGLTKFVTKCVCALLNRERGKKLAAKISTERIVDIKRKHESKDTKKPKQTLKLKEMKTTSEMETILPFSKKKFKKLESHTKVGLETNTTDLCNCFNTKYSKPPKALKFSIIGKNNKGPLLQNEVQQEFGKNKKTLKPRAEKINKKDKGQVLQNEIDSVFCALCRDLARGKQSLNTCDCPQDPAKHAQSKKKKVLHSQWCPEKIGDQADPCPACAANAKFNKKRAKQRLLHTCECPAQTGDQTIDAMSLCPVCKAALDTTLSKPDKKRLKLQDLVNPVEQLKVRKQTKIKNNNESISQIDYLSDDICSCCKEKIKTKMKKEAKKQKVKNKRKEGIKIQKVDKKPLFEMVVNENNMNIMNRDEVLANLGSTGKESRVMKKARKARNKGRAEQPLMDMLIDVNSAAIINSEDVLHTVYTGKKKTTPLEKRFLKSQGAILSKIGKASSLKCKSFGGADTQKKASIKQTKSERKAHDSTCDCCVCRGRRKRKKTGPKSAIKPRKLKPCVCGSVVCKKKWEKLKKEQRSVKSLKIKPCVCGSPICREESQKMPDILLEAARQAQFAKEKAKQDAINEKIYQKDRIRRKKQYTIEDRKRWKLRAKQDKKDMKQIKKYDNVSDTILVAESLVDIGKYGATAFCDFMRTVYRYVRHPRDAVYNVKDTARHPHVAAKEIQESCKGMGLVATAARVERRFFKMRFTKDTMAKMESHPVTNYILHMADRTPKHRMKKFKQRRQRDPLEFHCSLFMATLRKRPCLRVYYMCPWFYPHCVSLLGVWQQFTDILLFILAVGVWSPCILGMELCRALMCCFFCTG